jgi:hypothetical protein
MNVNAAAPLIQQSNNPTIQQSNNPTIQQSNNLRATPFAYLAYFAVQSFLSVHSHPDPTTPQKKVLAHRAEIVKRPSKLLIIKPLERLKKCGPPQNPAQKSPKPRQH